DPRVLASHNRLDLKLLVLDPKGGIINPSAIPTQRKPGAIPMPPPPAQNPAPAPGKDKQPDAGAKDKQPGSSPGRAPPPPTTRAPPEAPGPSGARGATGHPTPTCVSESPALPARRRRGIGR